MMHTLGDVMVGAGGLLVLVGAIAFVVVAFRESLLWGLGVLFVPFVSLIFLIVNWNTAKRSFFWQLLGIALVFIGTTVLSAPIPFLHNHPYHHHG